MLERRPDAGRLAIYRHQLWLVLCLTVSPGIGSIVLFVMLFCVIISMYGGGFSTIPAYLADMFGTQMVGAIHGRLLTAWSAAGILGPVLVNYLREYPLAIGTSPARTYEIMMYVLARLLAIGFLCNLAVRKAPAKYAMSEEMIQRTASVYKGDPNMPLAWVVVGAPMLRGILMTLQQAAHLFL